MPASDQQGNRFDLERRLLEEPHGLSCAHVAPVLINRNAQVLAEAPAKCSGVDMEFPCEANDRKRTRPVRRNPAASLLMNRVLEEVAPTVDERAAGVLKNQLGPRGLMAIVYPAVAPSFAHGLVDPQTPQPRVELKVDFEQQPAEHELFRKIPSARQRLHELLKPACQDGGVGLSCVIDEALAIIHNAREPVGSNRKMFRIRRKGSLRAGVH